MASEAINSSISEDGRSLRRGRPFCATGAKEMMNDELKTKSRAFFLFIPHSAFRIPHLLSCLLPND
jgi:hypothetical protein